MVSLQDCMLEYRKQLKRGRIQKAYKGLMEYMLALRTHFKKKYPEYVVSGSIYFGYMDMTCIAFFPKSLKRRNLKVAIVCLHDTGRFEAWLGGYNKQVQAKYWKMFTDSGWRKYRLVSDLQGVDSILEYDLVGEPDFDNQDVLTKQIEVGTLKFIQDILLRSEVLLNTWLTRGSRPRSSSAMTTLSGSMSRSTVEPSKGGE